MSTEVKMPQMGESIAEGTLTRWFKKPGESVERDEPLFEISTDKVDAEIPAPADGVLQKILIEEGTTVEVNTVVALLGAGEGASAAPETAPPEAAETEAQVEEPAGDPAPAAEPDPAPAPAAAEPAESVSPPATDPAPVATNKVRSSPLVRRIARENGITDLSVIVGSGAGGRVTKKDIVAYIEGKSTPAAAPAAAGKTIDALPAIGVSRDGVDVEQMSVMRKKIAEHMVHSRQTSAHVHSVFEADMTKIVAVRESNKQRFEEQNGLKLTFMPFFIKACVDALRKFRYVNASLDGDQIVLHRSVNIGIAVALENGLIVPVVKNAEEKNLLGLQKSVTDLANRSRSKGLLPDEVAGGTFTITNPGQFGGLFGIPIINQPQVAILGIGGIEKRPVVVNGDSIAIRDMVYLCLSYDHRLVDGALADQFMAQVKKNLEQWDDNSLR